MECMAGAEGCSQMLESHRAHLKAVSANAPLKALVDALRQGTVCSHVYIHPQLKDQLR